MSTNYMYYQRNTGTLDVKNVPYGEPLTGAPPPKTKRAAQVSSKSGGRAKGILCWALLGMLVGGIAIAALLFREEISDLFDELTGSSDSEEEEDNSPTVPPGFPTTSPTFFPTQSPTQTFQLFPVETRTGSNYVGVYFMTEMDDAAFLAFVNAANRWSSIVAGTSFPSFSRGDLCGEASFGSSRTFDHLAISATVEFIDGESGILGSAGPCLVFNGGFSAMGRMTFDSADIADMISEGSLTSVILHEMGHVLGIGTIWDNRNVLEDTTEENGISSTNQPKFTGPLGTAEYQSVTGASTSFIPVENGFTGGSRNSAGSGSLDSHWDQDFMPGELMIFVLTSASPPLSSITLVTLRDLGYTVDTSQADAFSASNSLVSSNLRGSEPAWTRYMVNDTAGVSFDFVEPL